MHISIAHADSPCQSGNSGGADQFDEARSSNGHLTLRIALCQFRGMTKRAGFA
jgi:hypothetical protein